MKRIIFCFDGTWNKINADRQTNVLLLASSIAPTTDDDIRQIVHYDSGVGTGFLDNLVGGIAGWGLFTKIKDAYEFLVFNYEPGDEVFAFGFSRGAFTARSFIGFIRTVGIIQRHHVGHIQEAHKLYKKLAKKSIDIDLKLLDFRQKYSSHISVCKEDEAYRCKVDKEYVPGQSYPFRFRYVGLWDTVETLGFDKVIRQHIPYFGRLKYTGIRHRYHQHVLAGMVASGRHAVALDEKRRNFDVEPWGDLNHYNSKLGFEPDNDKKPFQEMFFPGGHGSVGGGGLYRGLSDAALVWIQDGASQAGLIFDLSATSVLYSIRPIFTDPLNNNHGVKDASFLSNVKKNVINSLMSFRSRYRKHRPTKIEDVFASAQYRWAYTGKLVDGKYNPETLTDVKQELNTLSPIKPIDVIDRKFMSGILQAPPPTIKAIYYTVVKGDTLGTISEAHLGDSALYPKIFEANTGILNDPNKIYVGQVLRIPLKE